MSRHDLYKEWATNTGAWIIVGFLTMLGFILACCAMWTVIIVVGKFIEATS